MLNTPPPPPPHSQSPEHNRALLSGQTLAGLRATDGGREIVRWLECEQMSRGCHRTTVSLNFSSPLVFFFFFFLFLALSTFQAFFFQQQTRSIILRVPSFNLICLKLYDDEKSSIRFFFLFVFFSLFIPLRVFSRSARLYSFPPTSPFSI